MYSSSPAYGTASARAVLIRLSRRGRSASATASLSFLRESVAALQQAVEAIPSISETGEVSAGEVAQPDASRLYNRLKPQMAIGAGDGGTPMLPNEAVDAMEVFLRAKGAKKLKMKSEK